MPFRAISKHLKAILCILLLLAFVLQVGCGLIPHDDAADMEFAAKYAAVDAVKQKLNSPGSAKFCDWSVMTAKNTYGDYWEIVGYVDAQNGYGAFLRKNWTVTLELYDNGDAYRHGKVTFSDWN